MPCKITPARSTTIRHHGGGLEHRAAELLQRMVGGRERSRPPPRARQALLGDAQALAANLNTTSTQLNSLNADVNTRIIADVQQINSIGASIANVEPADRHQHRGGGRPGAQ